MFNPIVASTPLLQKCDRLKQARKQVREWLITGANLQKREVLGVAGIKLRPAKALVLGRRQAENQLGRIWYAASPCCFRCDSEHTA